MSTTNPPASAVEDDLERPVFSVRDLAFELEVTAAILRTLEIDQILYVVLSGVTSGEGLGFNRGLFLLVDQGQRALRTSMAIGPVAEAEAHRIWEDMKAKELTLAALLTAYDKVRNDPDAHQLTHRLGHLTVSMQDLQQLDAQSVPPEHSGRVRIQTMIARCLVRREPLFSSSLELNCDDDREEPFCFKHWGMVPLASSEHAVGVLVVDNVFSETALTIREKQLLIALANLTAIAVEKGRLFARMRALAAVDGLTGVANRRTYDETVRRMLTAVRQTGRSLSLALFDVDHFKQYNDKHGHLAGDDVLRRVASTLAGNARRSDLVARYGGEEFVVLLPETTLEQAGLVARKLVKTVGESSSGGERVTISAGVACSAAGVLDAMALFEEADRALYRAKQAGRNRVELAGGRSGE